MRSVPSDAHNSFLASDIFDVQNMGYPYLQRRGELVAAVLRQSQSFGMREEIAHDGILLMDRIMSTSLQVSHQQPVPERSR